MRKLPGFKSFRSILILLFALPGALWASNEKFREIMTGDENSIGVEIELDQPEHEEELLKKEMLKAFFPLLKLKSSLLRQTYQDLIADCKGTSSTLCKVEEPTSDNTVLVYSGGSGQNYSATYRSFLLGNPQGSGGHLHPELVVELELEYDRSQLQNEGKTQLIITLNKVGFLDEWLWQRNSEGRMVVVQ